jgi:hypothetical protein
LYGYSPVLVGTLPLIRKEMVVRVFSVKLNIQFIYANRSRYIDELPEENDEKRPKKGADPKGQPLNYNLLS